WPATCAAVAWLAALACIAPPISEPPTPIRLDPTMPIMGLGIGKLLCVFLECLAVEALDLRADLGRMVLTANDRRHEHVEAIEPGAQHIGLVQVIHVATRLQHVRVTPPEVNHEEPGPERVRRAAEEGVMIHAEGEELHERVHALHLAL